MFGNGSNRLNVSIKIINLNQIESEITLDLVKHVTVSSSGFVLLSFVLNFGLNSVPSMIVKGINRFSPRTIGCWSPGEDFSKDTN